VVSLLEFREYKRAMQLNLMLLLTTRNQIEHQHITQYWINASTSTRI